MNKKTFKTILYFGIFCAGGFLGKHFQKKYHERHTLYAGTLEVFGKDGSVDLFLALDVPPEKIRDSADVIFKIHKIA